MRKVGLYATWMQHDGEKCWLSRARYYFFVRHEGNRPVDDYNVRTPEARVRLLRAIRIKTRVNSLMIRRGERKKKERGSAVCVKRRPYPWYTRVQRGRRTAGCRELPTFSPFRDCGNRVTVSMSVFLFISSFFPNDSINA